MITPPRIGVYICHCGVNIAGVIDVAEVVRFAARLPGVLVAQDYPYMCSEPGQALIQEDIARQNLNRIVVASCSPRMHEPTFRAVAAQAGVNPYCVEMANIREQCSWVHSGQALATQKAKELVAAAVARASRLQSLQERRAPVAQSGLVIGGGIAGMQAALDLAEAGFPVTLVEQTSELGGHAAQLAYFFPTLEPAAVAIQSLIQRVKNNPRITLLTQAEVAEVSGYVGNFQVLVRRGGQEIQVPAGVLIVATGFQVFDARLRPELGYGVYPEVITTWELEQKLSDVNWMPEHLPGRVIFIQCVGSRDQVVGNPYCSRICCMVTAKQALLLRRRMPQAQIQVLYMDVRAYGNGFEKFYDQARQAGVLYRRAIPSEILRRGSRLLIRAEDTLLNELVEIEADWAVLASGMTPRPDTPALASRLKLSRSSDGFFMEAHPKLRPVDTAVAGVFLAGCCQGPKDIAETIAQARAAAASALIPLMRGEVPMEAASAWVEAELCAGCGQCAQVCPYQALSLHPVRKVMKVNPLLCQGCGACAAACPSGAVNVQHFTFDQFMAQIEALSLELGSVLV